MLLMFKGLSSEPKKLETVYLLFRLFNQSVTLNRYIADGLSR